MVIINPARETKSQRSEIRGIAKHLLGLFDAYCSTSESTKQGQDSTSEAGEKDQGSAVRELGNESSDAIDISPKISLPTVLKKAISPEAHPCQCQTCNPDCHSKLEAAADMKPSTNYEEHVSVSAKKSFCQFYKDEYRSLREALGRRRIS